MNAVYDLRYRNHSKKNDLCMLTWLCVSHKFLMTDIIRRSFCLEALKYKCKFFLKMQKNVAIRRGKRL